MPFRLWCKKACPELTKLFISLAVHILKQGPVPQHIAFILDGNRRFARLHNMTTKEGHRLGLQNIEDITTFCSDLEIKNVSAYVFSTTNFKHSKEDANAIMDILMQRLLQIDQWDLVSTGKCRIRYIGRLEVLSQSMRDAIEYAENMTRNNTGITLNVYCRYSSTDEMTRAVCLQAEEGEDFRVSKQTMEDCLMVPGPDLDILVRTSGKTRFSNFMLWQLSKMAYIQFVEVDWPGFSFTHLFAILLSWQLSAKKIKNKKQVCFSEVCATF
ncbi:dehydrodolichyl diphosphate synthase [Kickxella alabastrina]|uniref:dehydrodolichyl diphosphate synthase n=1 Tax=Kickxella alabastrina TaxID=61397 RepID=UPI00221ECEF4|nr:dehydrodolichyl diphosphate synthase [Kickxella alabastrina]KAI7828286.1 dehydrodolichyl diphosphate synthase [Kickxella alabastrina]